MRRLESVLLIAMLCVMHAQAPCVAAAPVYLARSGKPVAAIVISARPLWRRVTVDSPLAGDGKIWSRPFAEEVQFWIERATGARLPIVTDDACPAQGALLLLGESAVTKRLGLDCRSLSRSGGYDQCRP